MAAAAWSDFSFLALAAWLKKAPPETSTIATSATHIQRRRRKLSIEANSRLSGGGGFAAGSGRMGLGLPPGFLGVAAVVVEDVAVLDVDDPVGVDLQPGVVGDADHRRPVLLGRPPQEADHHLAVLAVERAGGLVREQQLGRLGEGAGDGDPLLLAA